MAGGPKAAPGIYDVKLKVDDAGFTEPLQVKMDPRSKATALELAEQQRLSLEIFGETQKVRRALAGMNAAKGKLAGPKLREHPVLQAKAEKLSAAVGAIERGSTTGTMGLQVASGGLQSALRVVEGSDRTVPQQALEVYRLSDEAAKSRMTEWQALKSGELAELTRALEAMGAPK